MDFTSLHYWWEFLVQYLNIQKDNLKFKELHNLQWWWPDKILLVYLDSIFIIFMLKETGQ